MKHAKKKQVSQGMKSAVVYTLASVFSRGLAFITVPIFTRLMTTSEMGTVNLFTTWQTMINVVVTLALTSGGYMVALKEFEKERNQYESSVLTLTSFSALACFVIYFINPSFWNSITGLDESLSLLMLFGFLFTPATDFWLARQRFEYKYVKAALVVIGSAVLASALSVAVVIMLHGTDNVARGRLFANYSVLYVVAIILWFYTMIRGKVFISKKYWKFSLALSLPLIANSFAVQVFNAADRIMIGNIVGHSAVGIYGTLSSISMISTIVWGAINTSFVPFLYRNIDDDEGKKKIKDISIRLLFAYSLVCVGITYFAPEVVRIVATEEYYSAIYIMPPLAGGIFQIAISNMYSNVLLYHKKSSFIMISSIAAACTNVALNAIFIPWMGYMSAAYTTLFAYFVLSGIQMFVSRRVHFRFVNRKETVYPDAMVLLISGGMTVVCLLALPLYKLYLIRYAIVCLIVVVFLILFKKNKELLSR